MADVRIAVSMFGLSTLYGNNPMGAVYAAQLAEEAGLKVVMNRCPEIELFRPFWKPRLDLEI